MKILVLMGGPKIEQKGKNYPLYMTEINKTMLIERNVDLYKTLNPSKILYCVRREDIRDFNINEILKRLFEESVCISVYSQTQGAICTALLAMEHINDEEELLITSIDEIIEEDYLKIVNGFRKENLDVGLLAFQAVHPRYSYVRLGQNNEIEEVAEKKTISTNALASFYYFKKGSDFVKSAISVLKKDNPVNGGFYISQTINEMILLQKKVGLTKFETKNFFPLKDADQVLEYIFGTVKGPANENS